MIPAGECDQEDKSPGLKEVKFETLGAKTLRQ